MKTYLSCPVLTQDFKNVIFIVLQLEIKKTLQKSHGMTVILRFWATAQPKINILASNFVHIFVVYSHIGNTYYDFWIYLKFSVFCVYHFAKSKFWYLGVKNQYFWKSEISCNSTSFGAGWLRFTLESYVPEAIEGLTFFDSKSRDMTSLKCHIISSKTYRRNLLKFCLKMLNWC